MPDQANQPVPPTEDFGKVPHDAESFRTIPNDSEAFGKVPQSSEGFRSIPKASERKENHTLTVREAARLFETAGVARTERSIVNWCQMNAQGIARLDAYFDPNERKYYITPQSVELAIAEEKAKAVRTPSSEPVGTVPKEAEKPQKQSESNSEDTADRIKELEKEVLDLKITNRGKDFFIEQLQKERDGFFQEVVKAHRKVGELETKLMQLSPPDRVDQSAGA